MVAELEVSPVPVHTRIVLDTGRGEPVSDQLHAQLVALIRGGELLPGSRLPTVRGLAADLQIAPNTVAKTYRRLEADGVIVTRGRKGTFVADAAGVVDDRVARAAVDFVAAARRLGHDDEEIIALVRSALQSPAD